MSARDLLLTPPASAVPVLLVVLLAVLVVAREGRRHRPGAPDDVTRALALAVRGLVPLVAVLLAARVVAVVT